jgi:hypothetical protein
MPSVQQLQQGDAMVDDSTKHIFGVSVQNFMQIGGRADLEFCIWPDVISRYI